MKFRILIFIALVTVVGGFASPQQTEKPLTKSQVMELVKAEMDNTLLAKLVRERGIDFEPTDNDVQALRKAGAQDVLIAALHAVKPQPLTKDQVLHLVAGGVPSERAAALVKQRGIDFLTDEQYLETLRLAGAGDTLIAALREASAAVRGELVVVSSPNAQVYLDGEVQGWVGAQGELAVKSRPGAHRLKVSLTGKKDFEQNLALAPRQTTRIEARLGDVPGSIRLRTHAGASISLDSASRGSTDTNGELVLPNVPPGAHELRVSAPGKKEYLQSVTVTQGQETRVEVTVQAVPLPSGQVRVNPKDGLKYVWIASGTFMMGCSPGDIECKDPERPPHQVTLTKGFWLGQTEVTVGAYKHFAGATGRKMPAAHRFNSGWENEKMPMINEIWDDAHDYCAWAGGRLPTEAEWEYAARGGSTSSRYGDIDAIAWLAGNSHLRPHEAAQLRPNAFGLFDILGNALEWVNDWYDPEYYQHSSAQDPPGPPQGKTHVLRGASWMDLQLNVRVSNRSKFNADMGWKNYNKGGRCVWEMVGP